MDEDNQGSFSVSWFGATLADAGGNRPLRDSVRAGRDTPASLQPIGRDELSPSNGQLQQGINALIEAMKSALEGDGVRARHYIANACASLADTDSDVDAPAAVSEASATRCCGGLAPWQFDTAHNAVKHITYVGRSPHEAFYTPDGREVWVTVRGEDYVSVLDAATVQEKLRITVPNGPGMQIFSPDGKFGYVCSSFTPETVVVSVADHRIVGHVKQLSPFCPNIAATPDGRQVWLTLKDVGKVQVIDAQPPFGLLKTLDTGPITNHVNFAYIGAKTVAYITIGALNVVKVFGTEDFAPIATIPVGKLPHGIWPSVDGTRMYVGLENDDALMVIDTATNKFIARSPIGQAPQAIAYVANAVTSGPGTVGLQPLGVAANAVHLTLVPLDRNCGAGPTEAPTSVSLFDQGLTQVLEAAVSGLEPKSNYVLALGRDKSGGGVLQPLSAFTTNPAGSAIVNAVGPIREIVREASMTERRYLVIATGTADAVGRAVQIQREQPTCTSVNGANDD